MSENPSMCADRKAAPEILGKVMVLGLGTTGRAVCDYLLTQQERLEVFCVYAGASSEDARAFAATLEAAGAQVFFDTIEVPAASISVSRAPVSLNSPISTRTQLPMRKK